MKKFGWRSELYMDQGYMDQAKEIVGRETVVDDAPGGQEGRKRGTHKSK